MSTKPMVFNPHRVYEMRSQRPASVSALQIRDPTRPEERLRFGGQAIRPQVTLTRQNQVKGLEPVKKSRNPILYYAPLGSLHPSLREIRLETQIIKVPQHIGQFDKLIQVPLKKRVPPLEWKAIQIDYLNITTWWGCKEKTEHLGGATDANAAFDIQFSQNDT
ncbi:hypothetical protein BGZ72_007293 [Mortierella alpina]|nr:hypothetical protein BGZ72_007293 [Mortierella alpina]